MTDKEKEDLQDLHDSLILMCKYIGCFLIWY